MIEIILSHNFVDHGFLFGVGIGVEPGLPGVEETTAPTSSLQFKFSGVGHSLHP